MHFTKGTGFALAALAVGAACVTGCPGSDDGGGAADDGGASLSSGSSSGSSGASSSGSSGTTSSGGMDSGPMPAGCGRNTTPCADGEKCEGAADCQSNNCRDGVCKAVGPANGVKDGDETDVDCGGTNAPACADGKGCKTKDDCTSTVCKSGVCQAPGPDDGIKNGTETDIDCGGGPPTSAPKCAQGKGCKVDGDCNKLKCDPISKTCAPPSATDGIKNGDETDVDCGGTSGKKCAVGQGCLANADCNNVACDVGATNACLPPSPTDGLKNGNETDVDCGGAGAPACAVGKTCALNADCSANACSYAKKCVEGPSCVVHNGGDTCGAGEVGQAGAAHESCCTSLPLPNGMARVDKYEITAGRMREFIRAVNNDVQGWVNANRAITGDIADSMVKYLPTGMKTPVQSITQCNASGGACTTVNQQFGIIQHLGNNVFMPDRPCNDCGQGCWYNTGAGMNGHPTYWWDNTTQSQEFGAGPRVNTQAELDVKSLNCTPQLLFAAFCAWDGGRLPTQAELGGAQGAWGPGPYPWGGTSTDHRDVVSLADAPNRIAYPFTQDPGGSLCGAGNNGCFLEPMFLAAGGYNPAAATRNWLNWNPFRNSPYRTAARYTYPPPLADTNDQAYAVAAPGRMRRDFRKFGAGADDGWYDVSANLIEATSTFTGNDNANHNGWPTVSWVGGSFEGHAPNSRGGYNLSVLTKYGKQGARCARAP